MIIHLKPTAGCNISTSIFVFLFFLGGGRGVLSIFHEQMPTDGTVLARLEFMSKVLPGPLTDLSALVGFCTSSPWDV